MVDLDRPIPPIFRVFQTALRPQDNSALNLKQLSELLDLSQTTISRALNGYPEVSERTRFKVVEAARKHGYKPNSNARKLATGRAGSIGYVLPVGRNVDLDPHFVEFLSGMGEHALSREVDLSLTPAPYEKVKASAYRRIAASRSVDGVRLPVVDAQRRAAHRWCRGLGRRSWRMAGRSRQPMAMPVSRYRQRGRLSCRDAAAPATGTQAARLSQRRHRLCLRGAPAQRRDPGNERIRPGG